MSQPEAGRAEINKANAQRSTGPKTESGKQRSSLNALRHGLTGQIIVLPGEDLQAYQAHLETFTAEYKPKGATEAHLVQILADTAWRLNRVSALENNLLTLGIAREPSPISNAPEQVQQALAIAAALDSQTRALSNLSLHGQRLHRQFERTLTLLREIQTARRKPEIEELNKAAALVEMHERKGQTYDPSEDGFVFTDAEIDAALHLRDRNQRASAAKSYLFRTA